MTRSADSTCCTAGGAMAVACKWAGDVCLTWSTSAALPAM
jgi:hypothetical protein